MGKKEVVTYWCDNCGKEIMDERECISIEGEKNNPNEKSNQNFIIKEGGYSSLWLGFNCELFCCIDCLKETIIFKINNAVKEREERYK